MRLIFMGNPVFAVPSLERLYNSPHEIAAVVSNPDKPAGRGKRLQPPAVKEKAISLGIPILQPVKLKDPQFLQQVRNLTVDILVVVAFRILPEVLFTIPPLGAVNLHASLLPAYRGAAPVNWALIKGEKVTGVTTFKIDRSVDTGGILLQKEVIIEDDDDAGSLSERLSQAGSELLVQTLDLLEKGEVVPQPQDESLVSLAPKIKKEDCRIHWDRSAEDIRNLIRGLSPFPAAFTMLRGKIFKIFKSQVIHESARLNPGHLLIRKGELLVKTGDFLLHLQEVQLEGRKRMDGAAFLRGVKLKTGEQLG